MKTPEEIKELAWLRLREAEILSANGMHDGAFYLAGYSVELILKAKICQRIGVPNIFDEQSKNELNSGISIIRNSLKTHNLNVLLIYSGLKDAFETEKADNQVLFKTNSLLFGNWDEKCRYKPCGYMKSQDVENLIALLHDENGLLKWIEAN